MLGSLPLHSIDISARLLSSYLYLAIIQEDVWLIDKSSPLYQPSVWSDRWNPRAGYCPTLGIPSAALLDFSCCSQKGWLFWVLGMGTMVLQSLIRSLLWAGQKGHYIPGTWNCKNLLKIFTLQSRKYIFLPFFERECNLSRILLGE